MLRTLIIDLKKDCPAYAYLKRNTTGTRALRNTALFYLRNTMTGLRKSPEERTKLETEVLHDVFTGIHMANEAKEKRYRERMLRLKASGMRGMSVYGYIMGAIQDAKPLPYPDEAHWCLSYAQLDAILKFTKNPSYYGCASQVNQQAVKKTVQAWKSWLFALSDWRKHPGKYRAKPSSSGITQGRSRRSLSGKRITRTLCPSLSSGSFSACCPSRPGMGCQSSSGRKAIPRKPACGMETRSLPTG